MTQDNQSTIAATQAAATAATQAANAATSIALIANDSTWIKNSLTEIKNSLNFMSGTLATKLELGEVTKTINDHEQRIRGIEKSMFKWLGMASVISSVIGVGVAFLLKFI